MRNIKRIEEKEVLIDKYEDKLGTYLMQLTGEELSGDQTKQVSKFLHTISDFERMGDHALNVARTAKELYDKKIVFSDEARYELNVLIAAMKEIVTSTVQAFSVMTYRWQLESSRFVSLLVCCVMN